MRHLLHIVISAVAAFVICPFSQAGPEWIEEDDAGSTTGSAQVIETPGGGSLSRIQGSLNGPAVAGGRPGTVDFEDVYQIIVTDPPMFLIDYSDAKLDFALYLFKQSGLPLLGSLDSIIPPMQPSIGPVLPAMSTDGTGVVLTAPGIYYLAISGNDRMPASALGPAFFFATPTEVSGPDGPGGMLPLTQWIGPGLTGDYDIMMIHGVSGAEPSCPADIDGDGVVGGIDLGILLASWSIPVGAPGCAGLLPCLADLNGDGVVDGLDLGILLASWSIPPTAPGCAGPT